MQILKELRWQVFRHGDGSPWWQVPEWELLVHTRQFSYEWQIQDLQDTENERVRNRQIEKELQEGTLQHRAEIAYEWQRKELQEWSEMRRSRRGNRSECLTSSSCKLIARTELTVNKYYSMHIIRMILGLEIADSRGDRATRTCLSHSRNQRASNLCLKR